jgi:hypothetical protein
VESGDLHRRTNLGPRQFYAREARVGSASLSQSVPGDARNVVGSGDRGGNRSGESGAPTDRCQRLALRCDLLRRVRSDSARATLPWSPATAPSSCGGTPGRPPHVSPWWLGLRLPSASPSAPMVGSPGRRFRSTIEYRAGVRAVLQTLGCRVGHRGAGFWSVFAMAI